MAGVALLFMPDDLKKLERHRKTRLAIAGLIFIFGLLAVVSDSQQKAAETERAAKERKELTEQIHVLVASATVQATKGDITELGASLMSTLTVGFDRTISASTRGHPVSSNKSSEPIATPATVPTVEHTTMVQRPTVSDDPALPYGLQVIIQSNVIIDPVALGFECDGDVGKVNAFIAGQGAYLNMQIGPADQNHKIAVVRFSFPALKPETPLVVTILSKSKIKVVRGLKLAP